jgi:phosphoglycerate dehydrogenase-like enzyme
MSKPPVLYTDPPWLVSGRRIEPALASVEQTILGQVADLRFAPYENGRFVREGEAFLRAAADSAVIVIYRCRVTQELLDGAGSSLRAVVRQGVGTDNLNTTLLQQRRLLAYNVPDYCADEVATHTSALVLALERRIIPQHSRLTSGTFDIYAGGVPRRTSRRTLGIVGFGRIGRAVTRRLGAFYQGVLVHDPYIGSDLPEAYGARAAESLPELLESSDVVCLHCPLTEETDGLIGAAELGLLPPGAYLVNTARGALIDPAALGAALHEGRLGGAALDVFAPENPNDDPRWKPVLQHPGVIVTSHRAFLSREAESSSRRRVAEVIREILAGSVPPVGLLTAGGPTR